MKMDNMDPTTATTPETSAPAPVYEGLTISEQLLKQYRQENKPEVTDASIIKDLRAKLSDVKKKLAEITAERDMLASYIDAQQQ